MSPGFPWLLIVYGLAIVLIGWLVGAPLMWIWWGINRDAWHRFKKAHAYLVVAVHIGAFLGIFVFLKYAFEGLLVFIPGRWGTWDEDGEFRSIRSTVAVVLAIGGASFLSYVFAHCQRLRDENRMLGIMAEFERRRAGLGELDLDSLLHEKERIERRLKNKVNMDEEELELRRCLLAEVERRIEVAEESEEADEDWEEHDEV